MKLTDIVESFISGDWGNDSVSEENSCSVFCIRGADIEPIKTQNYNQIPQRYISQRSYENKLLHVGDIIIEKSGGSPSQSTGRVCIITQKLIEEKGSIVCSNFCVAFRVKANWNAEYVYLFLQHIYNAGVFFNFEGKTSGIKNLQLEQAFKSITIKPIPLNQQEVLANVILNFDNKIAVNRAINRNLEAMAKQLYDYWFVQFDFPDENGKPYKSSGGKMVWNEKLKREIPEGWFAKNICSIAEILSGGTPSKQNASYWKNGTIPFFGPTDCNGNMFQISTAECITEDGLANCSSLQYDNGTIIITARGSIGKLVIVGTPMAMNQSCYALKSVRGQYEYLYFLTVQLIEHLKAKGGGSVFKSIITSDIENSILCIASPDVIDNFTKAVHHIFLRIKFNTEEIAELTKQRDELLPLLMNGQVTVTPPAVNCDL
jgi:type I restriction enzyme S subunit